MKRDTFPVMRNQSPAFRMADRLMQGRLLERIAELRAEGASWDEVCRSLHIEAGVVVTSETLRLWAKQLGGTKAAS